MANLNGIRFRFFNGITVGDINDLMKWINSLPSSLSQYVKDITKNGDEYTATIVTPDGERTITWSSGGGGTPFDYVERIQPNDYSITYSYFEKEQWKQNEIYFMTINGESVIGKGNININWGSLARSSSDPTTIEQFLQDNYCPESFAVELDERLHDAESAITAMSPKVARALLTPIDTPSAIELVGIGTNGAQQQIRIGDGLEVQNSTLRATGGGGGGNPLYLHTVSFNTYTSPEIHCQVNVISRLSGTYANFDAFWNDRKKIVAFSGTPNMTSNALYFNGAMADQFAIKARGVTFEDGQFSTDVIDIGYSDIDSSSFGDYGVQEL